MSLIPALGRQRQVDLYEFEVDLVYIVSYRIVKATYWEYLTPPHKGKGDNYKILILSPYRYRYRQI